MPPWIRTEKIWSGDGERETEYLICNDLDTLLYTLAGLANSTQGWGVEGETWQALEGLKALGGESWFLRIGWGQGTGSTFNLEGACHNGSGLQFTTFAARPGRVGMRFFRTCLASRMAWRSASRVTVQVLMM